MVLVLQDDAARSARSVRPHHFQILQNAQLLVTLHPAAHVEYHTFDDKVACSDECAEGAMARLRDANQQSDAYGDVVDLRQAPFRSRGQKTGEFGQPQ